MDALSTPLLWLAFAAGCGATWGAGVYLARATDTLDDRWKLGETFGGMLLLAVAGTLPEAAITVTAALSHQLDLAAGNLLGGIAIQTAVLAICDYFVREKKPLSYMVGSLIPVLEASLVIAVTAVAMLGALLPKNLLILRMSPASIAIVVIWIAGMVLLNRVRNSPKWEVVMPGSKPGRPHRRIPHPTVMHPFAKWSTTRVLAVFAGGSIVTLGAGYALTVSGGLLASRAGMNGLLFGATVLAVASALPEISTGIAAVRLGDHQLVMGDIFGGNAFQLTLFLVADLIAGVAVLSQAGAANSWLAGLGILVTVIYAGAVVVRPERDYLRLGIDSIIVLTLLGIGMAGLALLAR
jgi:cation:H+ antiporter